MFGLGTLNQARFNIYFPKTSGNGNETQASVTNFEGVKTFIKEIRKWPTLILSNTITIWLHQKCKGSSCYVRL